MLNRVGFFLFWSIALASSWIATSAAHAQLDACGGIFVSAQSACEYRPKQECMTQCMTTAVEESCVAQIYNECESSCTTTASTDCESSCTQNCQTECTTSFTQQTGPSCMDLCLDDCGRDDDRGSCGHSAHADACGRCAKHNCEKRCEEKCGDAEKPQKLTSMTECMPTCSTACSASCVAKVNTQCQQDCQERTYVQCEQKMVETCQTQCMQNGGAIFCDGQFLNSSSLDNCADELRDKVNIDIDVDAALETIGNTAQKTTNTVEKKVDHACTVANVGRGHNAVHGLWLLALGGLALWRAKRRTR